MKRQLKKILINLSHPAVSCLVVLFSITGCGSSKAKNSGPSDDSRTPRLTLEQSCATATLHPHDWWQPGDAACPDGSMLRDANGDKWCAKPTGKRHGPARTDDTLKTGQPVYGVGCLKEKLIHGLQTAWYENGQKESEIHFVEGLQDGESTLWFANGQMKANGSFLRGKPHGFQRNWHENGNKRQEGTKKHGQIDGKWTWSYKNGTKSQERAYVAGKEHGTSSYWDAVGGLMLEEEYVNGRMVGSSPHSARTGDFEVRIPEGVRPVVVGERVILVLRIGDSAEIDEHSAIIIASLQKADEFDPKNSAECEAAGQHLATSTETQFKSSNIIGAPFGKTCEVVISQSGSKLSRVVVVYQGDRMLTVTCHNTGHPLVSKNCQKVIGSTLFHPVDSQSNHPPSLE